MRLFVTKIFTLLVLFVNISCDSTERVEGNGNIITRDRELESFTEIIVEGNFKITLKKFSSPGITITTDENLHDHIMISQEGDILNISTTTDKLLKSREPIEILVEYTKLAAITSKGSSRISNDEIIRGNYLRVGMAGAGSIRLNVDLQALKVTISGAGTITLKGKVEEQNIQLTGAGGLEADELISQKCKIDISGVGGASIHVKKKLEASVSGVGGISYSGGPEKVISDISGMGTITNAEEK